MGTLTIIMNDKRREKECKPLLNNSFYTQEASSVDQKIAIQGHCYAFTVSIKGDALIQTARGRLYVPFSCGQVNTHENIPLKLYERRRNTQLEGREVGQGESHQNSFHA